MTGLLFEKLFLILLSIFNKSSIFLLYNGNANVQGAFYVQILYRAFAAATKCAYQPGPLLYKNKLPPILYVRSDNNEIPA